MSLVTFDFDGTLVDGDAGVHFARHMVARGYLDALRGGSLVDRAIRLTRLNLNTTRLVAKYAGLHAGYESGRIDRHRMVESAYEGFAGLDRKVVEEELEAFARTKLPDKLRDDVVDQLAHHVDRGDHVVVLSTGIHGLIWPLRDVLGLDFEVVACQLKSRNGELTGTAEGPLNGAEKATRMVAVARRRDHDLDEAYAYADHENDQPVLEMVGNPIVVHPTKRMRKLARRKGWPILWDG